LPQKLRNFILGNRVFVLFFSIIVIKDYFRFLFKLLDFIALGLSGDFKLLRTLFLGRRFVVLLFFVLVEFTFQQLRCHI
jgi:hypothetical protein